MAETNAFNPNSLARQSREQAVRQIEKNYKDSLNAATKARENAIRDARAAKAEAVKQAQAVLDLHKKRLSEARDHIETRLRKQELDEAVHTQEQILIKAENTRVKALKQAVELGKRLATEAAETRLRAIQQAYDDEKKMKLEAAQALKTQKETARTRVEEERKAKQRAELEAVEAKTRAQKAAAAERSARQALEKSRKEKTEERKPEKPATASPTQPTKPVVKPETAALSQQVTPVAKPETAAPPQPITSLAKPDIKTGTPFPLKAMAQKAPEAPKPVESGPAVGRTGMVKLTIIYKETDSTHMLEFENGLRRVRGVRLVMVGGTTREGAQIIVNVEKDVALTAALRQLPVVEEVNDRPREIIIKLKPSVISESNI